MGKWIKEEEEEEDNKMGRLEEVIVKGGRWGVGRGESAMGWHEGVCVRGEGKGSATRGGREP